MQGSTPNQQPPTLDEAPRGFLSGRCKIIIAVGLLIVAMGYLGYNAFQGATVFYFTVSEMVGGEVEVGEEVRVNGKLIPESFKRDQSGTTARFVLTDGQQSLPATHNGILPELFFNEHSEIVLQGHYGEDGMFQSQMVIVKCPSKYVALAEDQTV